MEPSEHRRSKQTHKQIMLERQMETMLVEQWAKMKNRRIKTTNDGQQSEAETFNGRIYIYVCMSLDQQLSIVTVDI